jgi:hypothetical protein
VAKTKKVNLDGFQEDEVMRMMGISGVPPSAVALDVTPPPQNAGSAQSVPPAPPEEKYRQPPPEALPTADQPVSAGKDEPPTAASPTPIADNEKAVPAKRKKPRTYDEQFLVVYNIGSLRRSILISPDVHRMLDTIVRLALNGSITLSNYVENIIRHHVEEYKDELNDRINDNVKPIL